MLLPASTVLLMLVLFTLLRGLLTLMVMLLPASTVLLMLVLFTLLRGLLTLMLMLTLSTDMEDTATWAPLDTGALSHMLTPLDPTSLMLSSMCPMVMLLPASTVPLMLPTDTEDMEDTATWVTLDTVALSHMLTPLDPTFLMLSSMCPMVTLLPASTALLTLVLSTLLRGLLTLSADTEDTDTPDLLPLDSPLCPMPASPFRDMLRDTDTDCGRCQDMGIHYIINSTDNKKKS